MNKFYSFIAYLKVDKRNDFYITFSTIEEMIGQSLCKSAYKYSAYWHDDGVHRFAKLIGEAGFVAKPDLDNKRVRFIRKIS